MKLTVTSTAFSQNDRIPAKYTCAGEDVSPPLSWTPGPSNTVSYALIMDDPDAPGGTFTHWVIFNIPADVKRLDENVQKSPMLENGVVQARTSFGKAGYGGPCPPPGRPHHYRFHLYGLDKVLDLGPGASKQDVLNAMKGHITSDGELVGLFGK